MNHKDLNKTARWLYGRTLVSMLAFLAFVALAINAFLIEQSSRIGAIAIFPIAVAVLILPRHTRTGTFEATAEAPEETPEDRALRMRLSKLGDFATNLRLIYLILVLASFFVLPYMIPAPS